MSEAVSESDKRDGGWGLRKAWQGITSHFQRAAILRILLLGINFENTLPVLISKPEKNEFHSERNKTAFCIALERMNLITTSANKGITMHSVKYFGNIVHLWVSLVLFNEPITYI